MIKREIRIGARGSKLAVWQAEWVKNRLEELHPGLEARLVKIKTTGDKITDSPLAKIGGKGLFTREIEEALLGGEVDLAVHSMKDMPYKLPEGLVIGCVPPREDPFDALVSKGDTLMRLEEGARVGSSSLRRVAQLKRLRPDLDYLPLRGNVETRIRKMDEGRCDAVVLAVAGLRRMGLEGRVVEYLRPPDFLPAVGQGAIAVQIREDDEGTRELIAAMEDERARAATLAERSFLSVLEGGCQVPMAAHASITGGKLRLVGMVSDLNGKRVCRDEVEGDPSGAESLGERLGRALLDAGAGEILKEIYGEEPHGR